MAVRGYFSMILDSDLNGRSELTRIPKVSISLFAIFALNYFAYVYFFDFTEGYGGAPFIVKATKDFVYAGLLTTFVFLPLSKPTTSKQWLFIPFVALLTVASLLHARQTGLGAQLWENGKNTIIFVAIYWAVFLFDQPARAELTMNFFKIVIASSLVQMLFSWTFDAMGKSLWLDNLYVGFMANPNSFGLLLNLAAAVCLAGLVYRKDEPRIVVGSLVGIGIATFGAIRTASSSQFVILIFLVCYSIVLSVCLRLSAAGRLLVALIVVGAVSASLGQKTIDSVVVPVSDLITSALGIRPIETSRHMDALRWKRVPEGADRELSVSVTYRREMIKRALVVLGRGPISALLGDFETREYLKMDGQFWVFLANDGILSVLAFGLAALYVYVASLRMILSGSPLVFGLHLMVVVFGITLLVSRVLQYFPLNWLFFLISGLLMAWPGSARPQQR
jgi:hypothetical protein